MSTASHPPANAASAIFLSARVAPAAERSLPLPDPSTQPSLHTRSFGTARRVQQLQCSRQSVHRSARDGPTAHPRPRQSLPLSPTTRTLRRRRYTCPLHGTRKPRRFNRVALSPSLRRLALLAFTVRPPGGLRAVRDWTARRAHRRTAAT